MRCRRPRLPPSQRVVKGGSHFPYFGKVWSSGTSPRLTVDWTRKNLGSLSLRAEMGQRPAEHQHAKSANLRYYTFPAHCTYKRSMLWYMLESIRIVLTEAIAEAGRPDATPF